MVIEIHREEMISKMALKEEKENAQGRSRQEILSKRSRKGFIYGHAVPCLGACNWLSVMPGCRPRSSVPEEGPELIPRSSNSLGISGYRLVRNALGCK